MRPAGGPSPLKKIDKDSPLRRLIKIFRTNTVVKHHIQAPRSEKPVGVAKAFFKSGYNFQSSIVPGQGDYDRFARYSDYAEMESYPILNKVLDILADEVTQKDEDGKIIKIISDNKDIQESLTELFEDILHLSGKDMYKLVRNLCKYGDVFYIIDATEENGVVNLINMPANEVDREEGFDKEEPTAVRFRWNRVGSDAIPNAYVAHFRLDGNDFFRPYGQSYLEAARRPWRQLVLLEDAMLVYRITRAPERRVYYLDIMGIPPEEIDGIVAKFNQTIKKEKVVNDQGKVDLRYGSTMSMEEDIIVPVRGQETGTRIDTLPGGQNASDIEDIDFIKRNLFASLGIPKAFLTFDEDVGAKSLLTQEDIRFARTVSRIQESIINELLKIAIIHLYLKGVRGSDLINFEIRMTNPSTVAELQQIEKWRARMELVQQAGEGVFDTTFIYKNFLHLTDEAIDKIRKGQIMDKMFQSKLMQLEANAGMGMGMDMMGGLGGGMGMGGFGGGMGGGMGMPPMDMGGAAPNVGGMPPIPMESYNPLNEAFPGTENNSGARTDLMGQKKDLMRGRDEYGEYTRSKETRGLDDLPDAGLVKSVDLVDGSAEDELSNVGRTYTSPMGDSKNFFNDMKEFLNEYNSHTKQSKNVSIFGYTKISAKGCTSLTDKCLTETFGGNMDDESAVLNENFETKQFFDDMNENWYGLLKKSNESIEDRLILTENKIEKLLNNIYKE